MEERSLLRLSRLWFVAISIALAACSGISKPTSTSTKGRPNTSALVAAGDATRNAGRFSEALQIYEQVLVADRTSVAAQYGVAECLLALGRTGDAKTTFEGLKDRKDYRAVALQGIGIADLALNNREEAATALHEAVGADPKLWRALNGLGLIADWKREFDVAAQFYVKALSIKPNSATLLNNLGYSRLVAGKPDEAIADFRKALKLDPGSETVQNNLRLAIAAKGDYAEATRNAPTGRQTVILNNVGFIAMRRGDLKAAESLLWQATEMSPNYDAVTAKNIEQLNTLKSQGK